MNIKHPEMVARLAKDGQEIIDNLTPENSHLWHMVCGVAGKCSELLEAILKLQESAAVLAVENVIEGLGYLEFYLEGVRAPLGIAREIATYPPLPTLNLLACAAKISVLGGAILYTVKKQVIYRKALDRELLISSLGKIEQYMEDLRTSVGISREQTLDANIAKLKKCYEGLIYSDKQAQDRADKKHETCSA